MASLTIQLKQGNLRDPSLGRLDGEQGEHGHEAVVVVERLPLPDPRDHPRGPLVVLVVEKEASEMV